MLDQRSPRRASSAAGLLAVLGFVAATAAWAEKPADFSTGGAPPRRLGVSAITNNALCNAPGDQSVPHWIADGNGGGVAVWADSRSGHYDIYAQRIDASGIAMWAPNGVPVCKAAGHQTQPTVAVDGTGGVIVTWRDARDDQDPNIYAQRLNATGVALWANDGIAICSAAAVQEGPVVCSDGVGGAIATWLDYRGGEFPDLYAQRVTGAGAAQWTADGLVVCVATGPQDDPVILGDGVGGAIVVWRDRRSGGADIYAQRVTAAGSAAWTADGIAVCQVISGEESPAAVSDGAGGAIITWGDTRGGNFDIYVQRVNGSGAALWTADGVALCTATGDQQRARLCQDGSGGAIVTWEDRRGANADVYARLVTASGSPQWTANGVVVCDAASDQITPSITADPTGGALVAWSDGRTPANGADVYLQRLTLAGAISWVANGAIACDTTGDQVLPAAVSDGSGGALGAWRDFRGGSVADLYSQRLDSSGLISAQCSSVVALVASSPVTASSANVYYNFLQDQFYWAGVAVRPSAGTDWDLEIYEDGTFGFSAYPICFNNAYAGSYLSSGVDFAVANCNDGFTPIGSYAVRATRYSGASTAQVEWDDAADVASKDCTGGNCGARSGNNWTGLIDVHDVFLFGGQPYTFDFTKTGTADIKMLLFSSAGTSGVYWQPRSARAFETTNRFTVYTAPTTGWYGLVFVNDNGLAGTYIGKITTGIPLGVGDEPQAVTGLRGVVPNPSRGAVRIQFALQRPAEVTMRILDMAGRSVGEVTPRRWGAGSWSVEWDGLGKSGHRLAAGMYFVEMTVDGQRVGQSRMALLR